MFFEGNDVCGFYNNYGIDNFKSLWMNAGLERVNADLVFYSLLAKELGLNLGGLVLKFVYFLLCLYCFKNKLVRVLNLLVR